MSAPVTISPASHLTCEWCGERRPRSSFTQGTRRRYSRCATCRYESALIPPPSDAVRTRTCWYCSKPFQTQDFTARLCSPQCRAKYRSRSVHEVATVEDERAISRAAKRLGVPKGDL